MYTGPSVVDYLTSVGQDASFANRQKLASQYGISGYTGTADQNTNLLNTLRSQKPATPAPAPQAAAPAPVAPAPDPTKTAYNTAGQAGLGLNELGVLSPFDPTAERNKVAQTFGFGDYDSFVKSIFARPEKSTQQIFDEAYKASGADQLLADITSKKRSLAIAREKVNDNPWLSEASRVGRTSQIDERLGGEIAMSADEYRQKLGEINELLNRNAGDFERDTRLNEAKFQFLVDEVERRGTAQQRADLSRYLPDYLAGKQASAKPETVKVGDDLYQYDPALKKFVLAVRAPVKATGTGVTTTPAPKETFSDYLKRRQEELGLSIVPGSSLYKEEEQRFLKSEETNSFTRILTKSVGGKKMDAESLKSLNKSVTVLNQLQDLVTTISEEDTGPIVGILRSANPYDVKAQQIKAQLMAIVPNLARGVYGEVGVLTDADIKNYAQTLPNLRSTEELRTAIIGMTVRSVQRSLENQLEVLAAAGRDVSGFVDIYNRLSEVSSQLGQTTAAPSGESSAEVDAAKKKYNISY